MARRDRVCCIRIQRLSAADRGKIEPVESKARGQPAFVPRWCEFIMICVFCRCAFISARPLKIIRIFNHRRSTVI